MHPDAHTNNDHHEKTDNVAADHDHHHDGDKHGEDHQHCEEQKQVEQQISVQVEASSEDDKKNSRDEEPSSSHDENHVEAKPEKIKSDKSYLIITADTTGSFAHTEADYDEIKEANKDLFTNLPLTGMDAQADRIKEIREENIRKGQSTDRCQVCNIF